MDEVQEIQEDPFDLFEESFHDFQHDDTSFPVMPLPISVQPSATCTVQMRSREDTDLFMVADERRIQVPSDSNSARRAVLNALRTIVPCRAVFRINDEIVIDLLLYDFFYRGIELRMLVVTLDTQDVFDAFAFKQDVLHLLASCRSITGCKTEINWRYWLKKEPNFEGFYIKCQSVNQYQSLQRSICSAAKHLKFNQSLVSWLSDATRPFFSLAQVPSVPYTWKPLTSDLAPKLYATPELFALTDQFTCPQYSKTGRLCPCDIALGDFYAEASGAPWHHRRLLPYVPSSLSWPVRLLLQPSLADIRSVFWSSPPVKKEEEQVETQVEKQVEKTVTQLKHPVYDRDGAKISCRQCTEPALCYAVGCCQPSQPLYCALHAAEELSKSGLVDMIICPVHAITSRVARLL